MAIGFDYRRNDPILHPYLSASSDRQAIQCLERLIDHQVRPKLAGIWYRFGSSLRRASFRQDFESEVIIAIASHLDRMRDGSNPSVIGHFASYVYTTAKNTLFRLLNSERAYIYEISTEIPSEGRIDEQLFFQELLTEIFQVFRSLPNNQKKSLINGINTNFLNAKEKDVFRSLCNSASIEFTERVPDSEIARELSLSPREIISLRLTARRRLARHLCRMYTMDSPAIPGAYSRIA